jgi:hypothetical protein
MASKKRTSLMDMILNPAVARSFFSVHCYDLKRLFAISSLYLHDEVAQREFNVHLIAANRRPHQYVIELVSVE